MSLLLAALIEEEFGGSGGSGGGGGGGGGGGVAVNPLDYGDDLEMWMTSQQNIVVSSGIVNTWSDTDPDQTAIRTFAPPGGAVSPPFVSDVLNGKPGVDFQEASNLGLNRRLVAPTDFLDNTFSQGFTRSISFAAYLEKTTDSRFNTFSTIIEKGYRLAGGWRIAVEPDGSIRFDHRRSNNSVWTIRASGFYPNNKIPHTVFGTIRYNGGNSSNSGTMRLYDRGSDVFVNVGSVSPGTTSSIGKEADQQTVLGNTFDPDNSNANAPFEGKIFDVWITRASSNLFDENYMRSEFLD